MDYKNRGPMGLILHTVSPSGASLVGTLLFVVVIVGFHLLLLSQDANLLLPHFAGTVSDQLAREYADVIVQPMNRLFGNSELGTLSTAVVWGLVGWALYAAADFVIMNIQEVRRGEHAITMSGKNQVVHHPLQNQLIIRLLWRFLWGMVLVVATIMLQPVIANLFQHDIALLRSDSAVDMLRHAAIVLVGWAMIFHLYTVLFRLFVLRTRIFGEIIY